MSRIFLPITIDELRAKIEVYDDDGWIDYRHLTPQVEKDLDKVEFSTENITNDDLKFGAEDMLGYQKLSNGMAFFGVCAGEDSHTPLLFIIYFDGRKLRGYIPEKGNLWNTTTKTAYGHDNESDFKNARKRWPDDEYLKNDDVDLQGYFDNYDYELMKKEIMERILPYKPQNNSKVDLSAVSNKDLLDELKRRLK